MNVSIACNRLVNNKHFTSLRRNMSVTDSEAVFRSRCLAIGLKDDVVKLLQSSGLNTMGSYAFCSSYVPGSADEKPFLEVIKAALKRDPTVGELAALRRMLNESYAVSSAEMKSMVEGQSEEQPNRKLPPAERAERFQTQQTRLKGLKIQGQLEPGDSLVDAAVSIYESDRLRYLEWHTCVSREHEILTSSRKDPALTFDSSGNLKMTKKDNITPCDASTDLQVKYCLTRRGLALEQGNVLDFEKHELWSEKLFACRLKEPPPGYDRVSFKQLQTADAKLFVVLGELTRSGVKVQATGRPCDKVFAEAMNSTEVQHLLQPMPSGHQKSSEPKEPSKVAGVQKRIEKKGNGKGSGKKGNTKGKWRPSVPQELLQMGCVGTTNRGNPLCYDYQLGKCALPVNNSRCTKGLHLCAIPGCHKDRCSTTSRQTLVTRQRSCGGSRLQS